MSWTSVFSQGSRAETDWQEGSKVLFLDKNNDGMVGIIAQSQPHEFMSIRHVGEVRNGVEDTASAASQEWEGALENYTLRTVEGQTELTVDIDVAADYKDYFARTWPMALERVKTLAEMKEMKAQ